MKQGGHNATKHSSFVSIQINYIIYVFFECKLSERIDNAKQFSKNEPWLTPQSILLENCIAFSILSHIRQNPDYQFEFAMLNEEKDV